jgi:Phage integrase family
MPPSSIVFCSGLRRSRRFGLLVTIVEELVQRNFHCSRHLRDWARKGKAKNTLRNAVTTLGCVIGKRFGKEIKYPSQVEVIDDEPPCFTPEQMSGIIAAAKTPQMRAFFATAAGTGMRSGELCGLRFEDVDLAKGIISVRRSAWEGGEQMPKTPNAVRKIGIDIDLEESLRRNWATFGIDHL